MLMMKYIVNNSVLLNCIRLTMFIPVKSHKISTFVPMIHKK